MKQFRTTLFGIALLGWVIGYYSPVPAAGALIVLPTGVQLDVPKTTVENTWGWTLVYQGDYGRGNVAIGTAFAGIQPSDYVLLAAKQKGSTNFTLLAAALASDVMTQTPQHGKTSSNGAEWYWNGGSIGFAGGGDTIEQRSADVSDSSLDSFAGINGELRLSWHTNNSQSYHLLPTMLDGGWRAGDTTHLNNSTAWERFVYVGQIPEPTTAVLLLTAAIMAGVRTRKE